MPHECLQDERIRDLTARVDKLEEKVTGFTDILRDIKAFQSKLMWTMLAAFASSAGTLLILLLSLMLKTKGAV